MEPWHYWLIAAIVLVAIEMLTADFFLALLGVAALFASIVAGAGLSFEWQLGVFVVGSIVMLMTVRPAVKRILYQTSSKVQTNVEAMTGKAGVVVDLVGGEDSPGRVKLGGEEWRAVADGDFTIEPGETVQVFRVDGATVYVRPKNTYKGTNA